MLSQDSQNILAFGLRYSAEDIRKRYMADVPAED
mgnify:CR=1 FL=1